MALPLRKMSRPSGEECAASLRPCALCVVKKWEESPKSLMPSASEASHPGGKLWETWDYWPNSARRPLCTSALPWSAGTSVAVQRGLNGGPGLIATSMNRMSPGARSIGVARTV